MMLQQKFAIPERGNELRATRQLQASRAVLVLHRRSRRQKYISAMPKIELHIVISHCFKLGHRGQSVTDPVDANVGESGAETRLRVEALGDDRYSKLLVMLYSRRPRAHRPAHHEQTPLRRSRPSLWRLSRLRLLFILVSLGVVFLFFSTKRSAQR